MSTNYRLFVPALALLFGLGRPAHAEEPDVVPTVLVPPTSAVTPAPAPVPSVRPVLPALQLRIPRYDVAKRQTESQRGTGIALVITGSIMQFAGVSLLVPAVWHGAIEHDNQFPVLSCSVTGSFLDGIGNILEITGWALIARSKKMERNHFDRTGSLDDR